MKLIQFESSTELTPTPIQQNNSDRLAPPADGTTNAAPGPFLLWFTSRVPAYGYGKSHGLSGIIRLLAFPPLRALEAEADVRDYVRCVFVEVVWGWR